MDAAEPDVMPLGRIPLSRTISVTPRKRGPAGPRCSLCLRLNQAVRKVVEKPASGRRMPVGLAARLASTAWVIAPSRTTSR